MPMNPIALGALLVSKVGPTDALGIAGYIAMGVPFVSWTAANVTVSPTLGIPLIAAGPKIVGTGGLIVGDSSPLIQALASAIGIQDAAGIEHMGKAVKHYAAVLKEHGQVNTDALVAFAGPAPPPSGPVSGTGGIKVAKDFDFATALNVQDAPGKALWKAFGEALKEHLESAATIAPTMTNLIGGPVTGSGPVT